MSLGWSDFTEMQQVAFKQAVYKAIAADLSTKDPNSQRSRVDEQVKGFYAATGAKSYDINFDGQKVGTYSVTVSKEVPEKVSTTFDLADAVAFGEWLDTEDGTNAMLDYIHDHGEDFARYVVETTGEVPAGVETRQIVTPAKPAQVKGTTLRVDPLKVARAIGNELPTAIAGLLGE